MTEYYNFLELIDIWQKDLDREVELESKDHKQITPSNDAIQSIIDYSLMVDVHSEVLNGNISICLN
jgi:hypothetical protein